ncbi:MAG: Zn(II)2Cys6 transcription factor domain-containing protein [archaeon]|nr:Zn(II)2Cys6 transcription factor domain-containing protein [archaeon]
MARSEEETPSAREVKRPRPSKRSCRACAKGHQNCDKERPQCGNCLRKRKPCHYDGVGSSMSASMAASGGEGGTASQSELVRQQKELIVQQQTLIEHLNQMVAMQASVQPGAPNDMSYHSSVVPSASHVFASPSMEKQYTWDPHEGDLHNVQCQANLIWREQTEREEAVRRTLALLKGFVDTHPQRIVVVVVLDGYSCTAVMGSPAFHEFLQLPPSAIRELVCKEANPALCDSRTRAINDIVESGMVTGRGGHTFLYEKSAEKLLGDTKLTVSSLASLFYDSNNALFAGLCLLTPHATPQPVVRPVVVSSYCPTCSPSLPPALFPLSGRSQYSPSPPSSSSSFSSSSSSDLDPDSSLTPDDWIFGSDFFRLLHYDPIGIQFSC